MKDRIAVLEAEIRENNRLYYDEQAPKISDVEYDKLVAELKKLYPASTVFQEIGNATYGEKYQHKSVMGSLDKCHTPEEIVQKFSGKKLCFMPKIDGLSLSNHYENGKLVRSVTRGNGKVGELVTSNAMTISNLPKNIQCKDSIEVRGEAFIASGDFYGIMDQDGYDGLEHGYKNPRNAASGGLRQKDSRKAAERKISFVAYRLLDGDGDMKDDIPCQMKKLEDMGFMTCLVVEAEVFDADAIGAIINDIDEMGLPYDTDGVVAILSGLAEYEAAGWSGKYPKGALAYKFETEKAVSYVKCIEFATTRTGAISVVAIIDPTEICGTTVSRLTLNNIFGPGGLIAKDVAVGDKILFEKANEIIPKLVKVLERTRNRDKQIPTSCPACGAPVSRQVLQDGTPGAHLMCTSQKCVARLVKTIAHILEVLQIKGIKEATIESLLGKELIKYPLDIFDLDVESLVKAGCGKRESEIWVKALHGVKATPECLLACMGAPGWGRRMFELLASKSGKPLDFWMEKILNGEKLDIASIVGPVRASILLQELPQGRQLLVGLMKKVGTAHVKAQEGSSLAGKSFCITGTLSKPREQIQADIRASGGIVRDSVSGKLNFLVAGTDCGGKKEKAEKLGVKVITEEELYNMAKG